MQIDQEGINFIKSVEGVVSKVYADSRGLPTIGVGHLVLPQDGLVLDQTISEEQVDNFLQQDLAKAEKSINKLTVIDQLNQNQYNALVSWCFNIGCAAAECSTVFKELNNNNFDAVPAALLMWSKPASIIGRRKREVTLWKS